MHHPAPIEVFFPILATAIFAMTVMIIDPILYGYKVGPIYVRFHIPPNLLRYFPFINRGGFFGISIQYSITNDLRSPRLTFLLEDISMSINLNQGQLSVLSPWVQYLQIHKYGPGIKGLILAHLYHNPGSFNCIVGGINFMGHNPVCGSMQCLETSRVTQCALDDLTAGVVIL